jgi:hypothetical protein
MLLEIFVLLNFFYGKLRKCEFYKVGDFKDPSCVALMFSCFYLMDCMFEPSRFEFGDVVFLGRSEKVRRMLFVPWLQFGEIGDLVKH